MTDAVSVMSGAEADVSSDGDSSCFEDEDVPLPPSPLKEGTDEPFVVVLKGGRPWGFTLKTGAESKSSILIAEIDECGKASGELRLGDYILQVNEVRCNSLQEAEQLVDSAFRTLTLKVWRGSSDPLTAPVRSASFLQKKQEISERARQQAGVQDDSILFRESKSSTSTRMKPRQRRIESFHAGRRGSSQSSSSSGTPVSVSTPRQQYQQQQQQQHAEPSQITPPTSTVADANASAKLALKGWATEHDLSSRQQPVIMSGSHMTRNVPLTPAKSSPSLNQEELANAVSTPRGYNPKSPPVLNMTKSTTDIPEHVTNYENVTSPTSPKSPSWYQQKLPSRSVFDFSSSSAQRRSPRNSYAGGSPRNSYASGSPRNSYAGGSPRNSYAGYSSSYTPQGFAPMSVTSSGMYRQSDSSRNGANSSQNQKLIGANTNSYDDTPTHHSNKSYDRRSLPPQALHQFRQEFQRDANKPESQKPLTSMPVTREEDDLDKEIPDMKPRPPNDLDLRPMYSPPAPPVRDISSLKYVKYTQNHEKFPSWPVTTAQQPQNLGPSIDTHQSEKVKEGKESESSSDTSEKNQFAKERVRNSPVERRGSDEKQNRNQSDPGFKQKPKKSFYTTRKPIEPDYSNVKPEGERFDEFCKTSKPGYPPPKLDPDGHNYGDEKYNIPSPPERDVPNFDEKSLVEKIAAVISPNSQYQPNYHHTYQYNIGADNSTPRSSRSEMATSPMQQSNSKIPGVYFQQAITAQNLLRSTNSQTKNMVDSGTSPIHSPTSDDKGKSLRTMSANPNRSETFMTPPEKRGLIIKQMPYYNTSTQTDENLANQSKSEQNESGNQSGQGLMSLSSVSSSASNARSDASTSSGISSLHFSDQSSAGMLRKLSEEFYRGKLTGVNPSEKRMSSASTYDELKSPRSDSHYQPGLREAESYSSVVIHAHESSGLFGRDDLGSSPSLSGSKPETSDTEHEQYGDYRLNKPRNSMDAGMILQKATGTSMSMPPRSLQDSRFTSESNLTTGSSSLRNPHSQSLMHLNRPQSSLGDSRHSQSTHSSSSTSSRPRGSMEARSSGSRMGSDSSTNGGNKGDKSRPVSDSVFYDKQSPLPADSNREEKPVSSQSVGVGRKESMKLAFGTYDENEHHYATPYGHQRNNSEVLSPTARDPAIVHGRSMSYNDYMPMHYNHSDPKLGLIKEEGSEIRWQEAVQKSRSLSREKPSNYENFTPGNLNSEGGNVRSSDSDKSDAERKSDIKKAMRRTASEQIRPKKDRQMKKQSDSGSSKGGYSSSGGESSKGNKSDSENCNRNQMSDLRKMQQKAVFDYVERKKKGSDSSEPQSPKVKDTAPEFPPPPIPDNKSPVNVTVTPSQPHSPLGDITKRYKYTQQQRGESLRRTQSITSNSSRDSDYVDMKRLEQERNYQTEWKRLRSMDGVHPRRPLSVGSDISSLEGMPSMMMSDGEHVGHVRSNSETVPKHIEAAQARHEQSSITPDDDSTMVTAPIYHNLSTGDYPRRPPPPVPGANEDKPPALPPRRFASSKSESFLLSRVDPNHRDNLKDSFARDNIANGPVAGSGKSWENGTGTLKEDAYAAQLRRQARRFSEQHKPVGISMQVVSTKSTVQVSLSQSYKQEPTQALEAIPAQKHSPQSSQVHTDVKQSATLHSPPSARNRLTPEPPPMPTPMKNGETEICVDLNSTADFPPPPAEFMEAGDEKKDRCADDSYGSYKTRETRELGKYKRATSDTSLLRSHQEPKTYRPHPELDSVTVAENTPNKPPRKKLELGLDSPGSGRKSNSSSMLGSDSHLTNQRAAPHVPMFQPAEVSSVQHAHKHVAKPLQGLTVQKLNSPSSMSSSAGSFVSTVVQRPARNQSPADRNTQAATEEANRTSVKDRVKNIEVFSHSPGASNHGNTVENSGQTSDYKKAFSDETSVQPDSLEQLESSMARNDSFRDRLRPVVKKSEPERTEEVTASRASPVLVNHRTSADVSDSVKTTPPVVPNRTYKQHQQQATSTPYRRESFQNRGPKPYENKSNTGANIHSPLGQDNFTYHKSGSGSEPKRSPGQSMPEPQVPSRNHKPNRNSPNSEQHTRDQNANMSSQESRISNIGDENVQNKDNTQVHSVQSGQKRNYEKSFSRTRSSSGGSSNNSFSLDPQNVATNYHNWHPDNTHSDKPGTSNSRVEHSHRPDSRGEHRPNRGDHSHRLENRGDHSQRHESRGEQYSEQKQCQSHDQRSSQGQSRYNQSHGSPHVNNPTPVSPPTSQSPASYKSNHPIEMKQDQSKLPQSQSNDEQSKPLVTVNHGRQPSADELECDQKAQELAKVLKDSDKALCEVLSLDKKSRMQFLDGILPVEREQGEERRPRSATKSEKQTEEKEKVEEPTSPMPSNYYVSPPKAMIELEIRKLSDNNQLTTELGDNDTLAQKKEELLQRMMKKVDVLKDDKNELLTDIEDNETLGKQVTGYVESKCRSTQEKEKFKCYIEDIDKIIRLLLKLSGLLARAENTIQGLNENTNEKIKKLTFDKRDRLYKQHEDAKELKLDIDRRSAQLENILKECLLPTELDDYHYYIKMKSKYTIQLQELEDKITLGNEQISALEKSMPGKK